MASSCTGISYGSALSRHFSWRGQCGSCSAPQSDASANFNTTSRLAYACPSRPISLGRLQSASEVLGGTSVSRPKVKKVLTVKVTVGRIAVGSASKSWQEGKQWVDVRGCKVLAPPRSRLGGRAPRGVVHFMGGVFLGAIPHLAYNTLLQGLADGGYIIVANPFQTTFDYLECVRGVRERFTETYQVMVEDGWPREMRGAGRFSPAVDIGALPVFGIGHSNGSLLHMLLATLEGENTASGNALISYNNRPASRAVPVLNELSEVLTQLAPAVTSSPVYQLARALPGQVLDTALPLLEDVLIKEAVPAVTQLDSLLLSELGGGVKEFTPTPDECMASIMASYRVPETLMVQFNVDTIDETPVMHTALTMLASGEPGVKVDPIAYLPGTHLTPLAQAARWEVGRVFLPSDVIRQVMQQEAVKDLRGLQRALLQWMDRVTAIPR